MILDNNQTEIVVALTGASGMIYAKRLIHKLILSPLVHKINLIISDNAHKIWDDEIGDSSMFIHNKIRQLNLYDFTATVASGSSTFKAMVVCPASMGIIGRIASGVSDCLITRAADVTLKERRRLILVPREAPFNLIHILNMEQLTLAGGIICPASPSFYSSPKTFDDLADTVVDRILDLLQIPNETFRWGTKG